MKLSQLISRLGFLSAKASQRPCKGASSLSPPQLEAMEARRLFSHGADNPPGDDTGAGGPNDPPTVSAVFVNSTQWSSDFRTELQTENLGSSTLGFAVPNGEGQLDDVPWANLNQVSIRFNEPVTLTADALTITGRAVHDGGRDHGVAQPLDIASFTFDAATNTATATLAKPIDRATVLRVRLNATDVIDDHGQDLDGEWHDAGGQTSSGDGVQGGDFKFRVNILPGDVNHDGQVDARDTVLTRNRVGLSIARPGSGKNTYSVFADFDGSGVINASDFVYVRSQVGQGLSRDDQVDDNGQDPSDDDNSPNDDPANHETPPGGTYY